MPCHWCQIQHLAADVKHLVADAKFLAIDIKRWCQVSLPLISNALPPSSRLAADVRRHVTNNKHLAFNVKWLGASAKCLAADAKRLVVAIKRHIADVKSHITLLKMWGIYEIDIKDATCLLNLDQLKFKFPSELIESLLEESNLKYQNFDPESQLCNFLKKAYVEYTAKRNI